MSIFLLSEKRLKADFLNDNIASELILPSIQTAQDIYLRQTLGDSLLDKICNLVRDNELEEPYKTLLDEYIIIYLEYLAMAELCVPSTFKLGNIGVAQAYDNNVNTQTIQNVKYLESYYKQKASFYENRLTTFIQQHCNLYPEYRDTTAVTIAQESTLQCGIYLGGTTSRKKIINNNSNNNNTEVGNYVRYDKAQNLSELEKAQARENIGVSSGGSADLSNYYTKEQTYNKSEINDLIDNVNSGEVDLSNYYKKSETYSKYEVDTLVDGVETFSGNYNDLTNKPDIYTKEQVDNLIENIDIPDLNNYYTKEQVYNRNETYSSSQVDTLISQVPTFSGNYNDLTNKPTLSNVATSGSYNDLSDKPTIPTDTAQLTKSDVYSKSEIDLQFESVNTTLGDINNLLETI